MIRWDQIDGLRRSLTALASARSGWCTSANSSVRPRGKQQCTPWLKFRSRIDCLEQGDSLVQIAAAPLHQAKLAGHGGLVKQGDATPKYANGRNGCPGRVFSAIWIRPSVACWHCSGWCSVTPRAKTIADHRLADHFERIVRWQLRHRLLQPGAEPGHRTARAGERNCKTLMAITVRIRAYFRVVGREPLQRGHELFSLQWHHRPRWPRRPGGRRSAQLVEQGRTEQMPRWQVCGGVLEDVRRFGAGGMARRGPVIPALGVGPDQGGPHREQLTTEQVVGGPAQRRPS